MSNRNKRKLKKLVRKQKRVNKALCKSVAWLLWRVEGLSQALNQMGGLVPIDGVEHLLECDMHLHGKTYACTCGAEPLREVSLKSPAASVKPGQKPN